MDMLQVTLNVAGDEVLDKIVVNDRGEKKPGSISKDSYGMRPIISVSLSSSNPQLRRLARSKKKSAILGALQSLPGIKSDLFLQLI
jgi:hypothetical protein